MKPKQKNTIHFVMFSWYSTKLAVLQEKYVQQRCSYLVILVKAKTLCATKLCTVSSNTDVYVHPL